MNLQFTIYFSDLINHLLVSYFCLLFFLSFSDSLLLYFFSGACSRRLLTAAGVVVLMAQSAVYGLVFLKMTKC
jgi:hypothetical protein